GAGCWVLCSTKHSALSTFFSFFFAVAIPAPSAIVLVRLAIAIPERRLVELVDQDAEDRDVAGAEAVADAAHAVARRAAPFDAEHHAVGLRADEHGVGDGVERRT